MEENKYRLAGWLAVVQAVLFPLMFIIGIVETGIAQGIYHFKQPFVGPSDLVGVVFSVMFFWFPAGLVLYWVVNNILSIAQQWRINTVLGVETKHAKK